MAERKKKPEAVLSQRVSNLLLLDYGKIPFRVDLMADLPKPPIYNKLLKEAHGKWSRGHMDIIIYSCRGGYGGLCLELKATDTVANTEHTRTQARYHSVLRRNGYKVMFACGYDEAKKAIKQYMKLPKNKKVK